MSKVNSTERVETVTDGLARRAVTLKADLGALLERSSLRTWNRHVAGFFIPGGGDYFWNPLDGEGQELQSKLNGDYSHFCAILRVLLVEEPKRVGEELEASTRVVEKILEQKGDYWEGDTARILEQACTAIDAQVTLLARVHQPSPDGEVLFVPDTNALLYNPDLASWRFQNASRFLVVLTPTVLSELDSLKVNARVEDLRKKAETLIRTIKGLRDRGPLTQGVPLVNGVSRILALAVEPKAGASLPWLDFENKDDRYLASSIEVMRKWPRSAVTIVTRDVNLQNKAEFAEVPYVEPPEPRQA